MLLNPMEILRELKLILLTLFKTMEHEDPGGGTSPRIYATLGTMRGRGPFMGGVA